MNKIPNPGSKEAIELGCCCAIYDNNYGEGFHYPSVEYPVFWISGDCPIHGKGVENEES